MSTENERAVCLLVTDALNYIEEIRDAKSQRYADEDTNPAHYYKRREMTMRDAKIKATFAAKQLRKAWDLLDPLTPPPIKPV